MSARDQRSTGPPFLREEIEDNRLGRVGQEELEILLIVLGF